MCLPSYVCARNGCDVVAMSPTPTLTGHLLFCLCNSPLHDLACLLLPPTLHLTPHHTTSPKTGATSLERVKTGPDRGVDVELDGHVRDHTGCRHRRVNTSITSSSRVDRRRGETNERRGRCHMTIGPLVGKPFLYDADGMPYRDAALSYRHWNSF